jgi:hypothetical protein
MSDGMRIALVGVIASLLGTLIGGGVTYAVTQSQLSSQKAEARRTERLAAYSAYLADTERFWIYADTITEEGKTPKAVTAAQRASLNTYGETLVGDDVQIALLAPPRLGQLANEVQQANGTALNALLSGKISYRRFFPAEKAKNSWLRQFGDATRADLGTS